MKRSGYPTALSCFVSNQASIYRQQEQRHPIANTLRGRTGPSTTHNDCGASRWAQSQFPLHRSSNSKLSLSSTPVSLDWVPTLTTTTSSTITSESFEPVLSLPALAVFLGIGIVFAALQWRVSAIESAVQQRTVTLDRLRTLKAQELTDPTLLTTTIQTAVTDYQAAYQRVEDLRTLLPGVRVIPPPSQTMTRQIARDNERAAQQFLGVLPTEETAAPNDGDSQDGRLTSPIFTALLIVIAISQISLLALFLLSDPMANLSDGSISTLPLGLE